MNNHLRSGAGMVEQTFLTRIRYRFKLNNYENRFQQINSGLERQESNEETNQVKAGT